MARSTRSASESSSSSSGTGSDGGSTGSDGGSSSSGTGSGSDSGSDSGRATGSGGGGGGGDAAAAEEGSRAVGEKAMRARAETDGGSAAPAKEGGAVRERAERAERAETAADSQGKTKSKSSRNGKRAAVEWTAELRRLQRKEAAGVYLAPVHARALERAQRSRRAAASSAEGQRRSWLQLRKSINGMVNRVTKRNVKRELPALFGADLLRGRGLLCQALMRAQSASPGFTAVYAAVAAVVNTKLPEVGELLVGRVVAAFRGAFAARNKREASALVRFIAQLCNQRVAHEVLALQVAQLLFQRPTDDSVEMAVEFTKRAGAHLGEAVPKGLHGIFEQLREILHEGKVGERVQYLIEELFAVRKNGFQGFPAVEAPELDLVEAEDQITHTLQLDGQVETHPELDKLQVVDPSEARANDKMWRAIQNEILGIEEDSSSSSSGTGSDSGSSSDGSDGSDSSSSSSSSSSREDESKRRVISFDPAAAEDASKEQQTQQQTQQQAQQQDNVVDISETELVELRRSIYLTIMSSLSHEESAHKLLKIKIAPGLESELVNMLIECCSQEKTYIKYYGLLGERFCRLSRAYQQAFLDAFRQQYEGAHRLETNKLRNIASLFGHLLHRGAMPWTVLEGVRMSESETTSSGRIFIMIVLNDLAEHLGMATLRERFAEPSMQTVYRNIMPLDNLADTKFSINFFTEIGLGYLTDGMREHLANAPLLALRQKQAEQAASKQQKKAKSSDSDSDSSSGSSSSSSGSGSSSSSSSSSGSGSSSSSSSSGSSSTGSSGSPSSSSASSSSSSSSAASRRRKRRKRRARSNSSSDTDLDHKADSDKRSDGKRAGRSRSRSPERRDQRRDQRSSRRASRPRSRSPERRDKRSSKRASRSRSRSPERRDKRSSKHSSKRSSKRASRSRSRSPKRSSKRSSRRASRSRSRSGSRSPERRDQKRRIGRKKSRATSRSRSRSRSGSDGDSEEMADASGRRAARKKAAASDKPEGKAPPSGSKRGRRDSTSSAGSAAAPSSPKRTRR